MGKKSVLLFMVDQLSAKWLEAAGSGICPTPNIDNLAKRGTQFSNAITSNPVCCPTRATLATGLSTRGHGVLENGYALDSELPTFMKVLQDGGWSTAAFGKVHFQPHFAGLYPDYRPYGFDVVHNTEDPRGGPWLDWIRREYPEHFEAALATTWPTVDEFASYGPEGEDLRTRIEEIKSTFDFATDEYPLNTSGAYTLPFPDELSQTEWITAHTLSYLKTLPRDKPFFIQASYVQPHSPFQVPARYMPGVDESMIPDPVEPEWVNDPFAPHELKRRTPDLPADWRYRRHCYFADISHLDAQLGKITEFLEISGRLEDTYVIFLSDHGELLYDHGFTSKEEKHYDACIRVPMMIAGPGIEPGNVCTQFVQHEDVCPTILDMTGTHLPPMPKLGPYLPVPQHDIPILPGKSLMPFCRGESPQWRDTAYTESYNRIDAGHPTQWARTVRTQQYRYTLYPGGDGQQLFDLQSDPDETNNLAGDSRFSGVKADMKDRLLEAVIMQDFPKTRRSLFALGVH